MKWIRRLLLIAGIILLSAIALAGYSYHLARDVPEWYAPRHLTADQEAAAANQADQDLLALFSYAGDVTAAQRRGLHHSGSPAAEAQGIGPKTITISEDEADAFLAALSRGSAPGQATAVLVSADTGRAIDKYMSDPRLVFSGNRLICAATLKAENFANGTVASLAVIPSLGSDGLRLNIDGIYAGRLPMPRSMMAKEEGRFTEALRNRVSTWQQNVEFYKDGTANRAAGEVALAKMLLASLADQAAAPDLFLPAELGSTKLVVPLRITDIHVVDGSLSITLRPLTADELAGLANVFNQ